MSEIKLNDVVQFNKNHKWIGCFGIVTETKKFANGSVRYMVEVPIPHKGIACIFVMESENAIEKIGKAVFALISEDNE